MWQILFVPPGCCRPYRRIHAHERGPPETRSGPALWDGGRHTALPPPFHLFQERGRPRLIGPRRSRSGRVGGVTLRTPRRRIAGERASRPAAMLTLTLTASSSRISRGPLPSRVLLMPRVVLEDVSRVRTSQLRRWQRRALAARRASTMRLPRGITPASCSLPLCRAAGATARAWAFEARGASSAASSCFSSVFPPRPAARSVLPAGYTRLHATDFVRGLHT